MKTFLLLLAAMIALGGCTDAGRARIGAMGNSGSVTCYSGTLKIFESRSTGKIQRAESGADGYYFVDAATNKLTEVSGNCVIVYE